MESVTKRESWIDNVKVLACTLVVLGHFFQSMTTAGILPATELYHWFNHTIYYFHVALFFICSGYLHQKSSLAEHPKSWSHNIMHKALALGIPYFTFSLITWGLKNLFSGSVNTAAAHSLPATLFLYPLSPYWYLYVLFFLFLITPVCKRAATLAVILVP